MSGKDISSKVYLSKNQVFADLFNFFIYNGNQVINPDKLTPLSTEQIAIFSGKGIAADASVHRYRDLLKMATIMANAKDITEKIFRIG